MTTSEKIKTYPALYRYLLIPNDNPLTMIYTNILYNAHPMLTPDNFTSKDLWSTEDAFYSTEAFNHHTKQILTQTSFKGNKIPYIIDIEKLETATDFLLILNDN